MLQSVKQAIAQLANIKSVDSRFDFPCSVCWFGNLDTKKPLKELEEHIQSCLKKEKRSANVAIFDKEEDFLKRVEQMTQLEEKEPKKDGDRARILFEISL